MGVKDLGKEFIEHYASKYYDPVKAREYYLKNRELKGRKAAETKKLSDTQKSGLTYVKSQIAEKKKDALTKAATAQTAKIENLKKTSEAKTAELREKLSTILAGIQAQTEIPPNASPKLRAFLERQNAQRSNRARSATNKELRSVATNLKSAVSKAREDYKKSREAMVKQFATDLETEQKNVKTKVK